MKIILCILFGHMIETLDYRDITVVSQKWQDGFPTEDKFTCIRCGEERILDNSQWVG